MWSLIQRQMRYWLILILVSLVSLHCTPSPAQIPDGPDRQAIRQVFNRLTDAYSRQEEMDITTCWYTNSEWYPLFIQEAKGMFRAATDIQFQNIKFGLLQVDGTKSQLSMQFDLSWRDRTSKKRSGHEVDWQVRFVKVNGSWKLFAWRSILKQLIDLSNSLIQAKTQAERATLLDEQKEFVLPRMVSQFYDTGCHFTQQRKFAEALRFTEIAQQVAESLGDKELLGWSYSYKAGVFAEQDQDTQALDCFRMALSLFQQATNREAEAKAHVNVGSTYAKLGKYEDALSEIEKGRQLAQSIPNPETELLASKNSATILEKQGDLKGALQVLQSAASQFQQIKSPEGRSYLMDTLLELGSSLQVASQYWEALNRLFDGRKIASELGDFRNERRANRMIGNVYAASGQFDRAIAQYNKSVPADSNRDLFMRALLSDDKREAEQIMTSLGVIYLAQRQYTYASLAFAVNVLIAKDLADKQMQADALHNDALVFDTAGDHERAIKLFTESAQLFHELGFEGREASLHINLGFLYLDTRDYMRAQQEFTTARQQLQTDVSGNLLFRCNWGMGAVYQAQQQWSLAADSYRSAIQDIEKIRTLAQDPLLRAGFFQRYTLPYFHLAECLLQLGNGSESAVEEAFTMSERAKARSLNELMRQNNSVVFRNISKMERKELERRRDRAAVLARQLNEQLPTSDTAVKHRAKLKEQADAAMLEYNDYSVDLDRKYPQLQEFRAESQPASLTQINTLLYADRPEMCILSYYIGPERSFVFVITRGPKRDGPAAVKVYPLRKNGQDITESFLAEQVNNMRRECSQKYGHYAPYARLLYEWLVTPIQNELRDKKQLVILPDGILHILPFQALQQDDRSQFLAERYAISYAPSVTSLVRMMQLTQEHHRKPHALSLLAVSRSSFPEGYPVLPFADKEVKSVAGLFDKPARLLLQDTHATKEAVRTAMQSARYIYLATHGEFNADAPLYSGIALQGSAVSPGFLTAQEIMETELTTAELVVLSVCDTARGQQLQGEGLLGLAWSLFVARCPSSIMTQWLLSDESASLLMQNFFRLLRTSDNDKQMMFNKADALQQAQKLMIQTHPHPYYWAAFVLIGDWTN